jgi:nicotinamide mononucleotide transporter
MPSNLLNLPFISFFTILEWLAAGLGLASVIGNLTFQRWGWLAQAASGIGYGAVFYHQNLTGLATLQIYFVGIALWAWWVWSNATFENAAKVRRLSTKQIAIAITVWAIATIVIGGVLAKLGQGDTAFVDAFITSGSILAQWLMLRYFTQTWNVWLAVNLVSAVLFFYSNLVATGLLYCIFTVLALMGARSWQKQFA